MPEGGVATPPLEDGRDSKGYLAKIPNLRRRTLAATLTNLGKPHSNLGRVFCSLLQGQGLRNGLSPRCSLLPGKQLHPLELLVFGVGSRKTKGRTVT